VRVDYKPFPFHSRGLERNGVIYRPVLPVTIIYNHTASKRLEAVVDTGCDACLFQSHVGEAIGIKIKSGVEGPLGGVIYGPAAKVYYHKIKLIVGSEFIEIKAGFSSEISQNLLGQIGFLDQFHVTFDPRLHPPCIEIERIRPN
jgi:hypothetical protein